MKPPTAAQFSWAYEAGVRYERRRIRKAQLRWLDASSLGDPDSTGALWGADVERMLRETTRTPRKGERK
jgi:hypothetical protein